MILTSFFSPEPVESDLLQEPVEGVVEIQSPDNVEDIMDRDARASGNSHFLRPLRAPNQHFLRSLKKRGLKSGGKMHFLRSLR